MSVSAMGRKSKKNQDRRTPLPAVAQPLGAGAASPTPPAAAGHYQPVREDVAPRLRHGARLLPLQGAGGLRGLERTAPQPRQPPETLVRRAATTTPTGMRVDGSDELQQQLLEKDETIAALETKIRELEKEKEQAVAAATLVATLQSKLQATHEGFAAAEIVIKRQEEQIKMLQAQVRGGETLIEHPAEPQETSADVDKAKSKPTAREIAAAHVEQGMLWIDPWVTRGERIGQVRQMCTAGVRPQLAEVARQGKQALLTGIVNLREQIETTDDLKEKEALSFFRDFTDEVIKRA